MKDDGRIIYNVTVKVNSSVAPQWLSWMLHEHIPEVMNTSCFLQHRVLKILDIEDDDEGPTYSIQYSAASIEDFTHYINNFAENLRKKSFDKWGDNFIAFRTLMEVVQ